MAAAPTYDFIVVGAGASGAVVASRLSEHAHVKVLLIEAGGPPPEAAAIPAACASMQRTEVDWAFEDTTPGDVISRGLADKKMRLAAGKMLGGSTSINFMAYVRGHPNDYDAWEATGAVGWGYQGVLPYFKKSEGFAPRPDVKVDLEVHGTEGPWSVTHRGPPLPSVGAFLKAVEEMGFEVGDYNSHAGRRTGRRGIAGPHQFTIKDGKRCSTYNAFLESAMARPNLTVVTGAQASRVLLQGGSAVGVEYMLASGSERALAAKEVVLSCGAYMSPRLLLRSGVGPRTELEALGVECHVDSPHVGKHLKDHLFLAIPFECASSTAFGPLAASLGLVEEDKTLFEEYLATGKGFPATSLYEASVFLNTGTRPEKSHTHDGQISWMASCYNPDFYKDLGIVDFEEHFHVETMFHLEKGSAIILPQLLQPESEGEVTLSGAAASDPPRIRNNYLAKQADVKAFVAICKQAIAIKDQIAKAEQVGEVLVPKNLASRYGTDLDSDELWEAWIRHYANTVYHPTSTCRIGDVVDARCRVKGLRGLRVADASIMPDVISGNTQAACVMIGEKAASMIVEDNGVAQPASRL